MFDDDDFIDGLRLKSAPWADVEPFCRQIRDEVFVREQGVPVELEHDGKDPDCVHVLASLKDGTPVGTGRLLPDGHIGRMAVRKTWRGQGVGGAMLALLIEEARTLGHLETALNAQVSALDFYRSFGFEEIGERFIEAGLQHQAMHLRLD